MAANQTPSHPSPSHQPSAPSAIMPGSEGEYLQQQADLAMRATKKALGEAKANLARGLRLETVAREHPWVTVAAGALAGFATGAIVTPNKRDVALKRLAEIERALHPLPPSVASAHAATDGRSAKGSGITGTLVSQLFALAKPVLLNGITAMMAAQTAASAASEQTAQTNAAQADGI